MPLDDLEGHARFQGFGVPIGGGDLGLTTCAEYRQMFEIGKIDIAQPDVTMVGGITELMRLAALAPKLWQARRDTRLQVEHHHRRQSRFPVSALRTTSLANIQRANRLCAGILRIESFPIGRRRPHRRTEGPGLGVSLNERTISEFRVALRFDSLHLKLAHQILIERNAEARRLRAAASGRS